MKEKEKEPELTEIQKILKELNLNPKQLAVVEDYLQTINATRSYMKVYGCSYEAAQVNGPNLIGKARKLITARMNEIYENLGVTPERMLKEASRIAYFDPEKLLNEDGSLKKMSEIDEDTRAVIGGIEIESLFEGKGKDRVYIGTLKKIKVIDKKEALKLMMAHREMFKNRVELTGKDGEAVQLHIYLPEKEPIEKKVP